MKRIIFLLFFIASFASICTFAASYSSHHSLSAAFENLLNLTEKAEVPLNSNETAAPVKATKPAINTAYTAKTAAATIATTPDFSLVGYATLAGGTTGGAGGTTITVTTGTQLQAALTAKIKQTTPLTIYVAGKITPENSPGLTKIDIKDLKDVSVLGVGTSGEFDGIGLKVYKASNVIIRNVKVHHVRIGDKDCISIEGPADHIWVDHCELYNEFQGVGKDYYDALLDAKAESEYITFSWNYLHDSWKASLSGSSESDTYDRKITYHHNYFRNLNSRLPLYRGGTGHVFNNYYKDVVETAINSRIGACLKIENNYFLNVSNPYVSAYSTVVGYGDITGNVLVNSPFTYTVDEKELGACSLNIPYTYSNALHTAEEVPAVVEQYAGVGVIDVMADGGGTSQPQPTTYQLTTSVTGQGTVSPASGTYADGASATLTATPAAGWVFSNWSGAATGTTNPLTLVMSGNKSVTANFTQTTSGGGDGGTPPSGPTVRIDNTATAATGLCSYDGSLRAVGSVNVINLSNTAGKGVNWKVEVPAAGTYSLQWRYAGGGSTAQETAKLLVNGTVVNAAVAFPRPAGGSSSFLTTTPTTVNLGTGVNEIRIEVIQSLAMGDIEWIEVTGTAPVAADCSKAIGSGGTTTPPAPATYTLAASSTPAEGGSVTFSPAGGTYEEGTTVTATATPATGFEFSGWTGDASGTALTAAVLMNGNKTISAAFTQISTGGGDGGNTTGGNYYVSPTGSDGGNGTISSPFRSIQHAIAQAAPGDHIYLRGGVYNEPVGINIARGNNGTPSAPKHLFAYEGEVPVLNFSAQTELSTNRGLTMNGDYWHVKGLIVEEAGDNGIFIGGNNNTVESCITRRNRDTGLQLGRYSSTATVAEWPSNNLILNCESYDNKDSGNENADGFAAKLTTGPGNVFRGCVAHHNIDDGWDLYTKTDTGPIGAVTLEDCIAHSNGTLTTGGTSGNGDKNGFKLGGEDIAVNHIVRRCIAFNNGKHGFTYNRNLGSIEMTNNTGYKNAQRNFTFEGGTHVYKNNLSFQSASNDKLVGTMAGPNAFTNGTSTFGVTAASFQTLTPGPDANPTSNGFLHLAPGSNLINAGVATEGITYKGSAPDLGALESDGTTTTPVAYSLTVTATPSNGGTVTRNPDKSSYAAGEVVTLTATAASGYTFSNWTGAASGTAATTTVTINSNTSVGAAFAAVTAGGGSTPTGSTVRIDNTATAATGLCMYDGVLRAVGSVNVINLSNSAAKGITWKVEVPEAGTYSLQWRYAGGGSTAAETAKLLVNGATALENVSFPKPASSTSFLTTAPVTVPLGKGVNQIRIETTVAAAFADIEWIEVTGNGPKATDCSNAVGSGGGEPAPVVYTLATSSNPANGGTVTLSPEGGSYEEGTTVTATATPADGWHFSGWSGNASGGATTAEVMMDGNKAVVANFYQITTERISASATTATGLCSYDGGLRLVGSANTLNLSNTAGRGVNWKVEVPAAGTYQLQWRYAGGGSTAQETARLLVNGNVVNAAVAFPKPANSTSFLTTELVPVTLSNGVNEIRIEVIQSLAMGDIEWLEVTGNGPKATDCSNAVGSGGGSTPAPVTYTLAATSNPSTGGTVTFSPAGGTYTEGTQVTVTATPASGYSFTGWSGDASGTATTATVVMNSNKSVAAAFTIASTGPDPNPGPAPSNAGMAGYATVSGEGYTTTTGGEGGAIITISTLAQLQNWALTRENKTTPEIVYINGKIEAPSTTVVTIKHGANVSVIGIGSTAELKNVGLNFRNYKNVIVRNLKIHEVFYPNDALTIDECQHVWVDHNEFHSKIGAGIGVDTYDGLLDIKNGSRYVTVSWNYFHDHMKTVLIGHTDNTSAEAVDRQIRVTFHHNYFENTDGRNPSLRWGAVHMYNNYLKNITDYGMAARQGAHALVENNVYENVKLPLATDKFTGVGYICERGNLFTGTSGANSITQTDCDWWNATTLPYAYILDDVNTLASTLPGKVGVGKLDATDEETDPQPVTYQLSTSVTGQGAVTAGGTFEDGTTAEISATPATGWQFAGWSGDASGIANPLVVTMNSSKTILATFTQIQHQLTTSVAGQGEVTAGGTYNEGASAEITATPAAGWLFANWSGDATGTGNPLVVPMSSSKAIVANFTQIQHQLTTSATGQGEVTAGGTFNEGATTEITATPAAGWQFSGWSGDASGTDNPLSVTISSSKTIVANFTEITYQLATSVTGNGSINNNGTTHKVGSEVTLSATPATGWKFEGWSGDASGITNPLTLVMTSDKTVQAIFTEIVYNLTTAVTGQGSLSVTRDFSQKTATLTATPATGWKFTGWSGAASGTTNSLSITMDADKAVTANFARIEYNLSVTLQGEGTVNIIKGTYTAGSTVQLTATPASGWEFAGWSGSASGTTNPLSVTMNSDKAIVANFVAKGNSPAPKELTATVYPNPFSTSATFEFTLREKNKVKITLYTFDGTKAAEVLNGSKLYNAGTHSILYLNKTLKPGVYIYVVEAGRSVFRDQVIVE